MFKEVLQLSDIEGLVEVAQEIWTEHYTPIIGTEQVAYMLRTYHSAEIVRQQIVNENYDYFLLREDDDVIGYVGVQRREQELFLSKIYLLASARGQGYGKRMMDFVIEHARKHGYGRITLTVNRNNTDTIAAYYKLGFIKTGEQCADIGKGYVMDDFLMARSL